MKLKRKYRNTLATLLLLLYAFIATPVSYWHQHKSKSETNDTVQHYKIIKKVTTEADEDCATCSHHYAVADNNAIVIYFSPIKFSSNKADFYFLQKISNPSYRLSNKGPPVVA